MIRRRMGRPGLVGTMARTAVIAGTASAVSGSVQRNQQARAQQAADQHQMDADYAALQAQQAAAAAAPPSTPPAAAAAPAAAADTVAELTKLGELRQAGILDDAEFAAAKAKLLGI